MKWEYKTVKLEPEGTMGRALSLAGLDGVLTDLGRDGWELATSVGVQENAGYTREIVLIFKRSF